MRMNAGPYTLVELVGMRRQEAGEQNRAFLTFAGGLQAYFGSCPPNRRPEVGTAMLLLADVPHDEIMDDATPALVLGGVVLRQLMAYDRPDLAKRAQAATHWDALIDIGRQAKDSHLRAIADGMHKLRDPRRDRVAAIEWIGVSAGMAVNTLTAWSDVPSIVKLIDEGMHKVMRRPARREFEFSVPVGVA